MATKPKNKVLEEWLIRYMRRADSEGGESAVLHTAKTEKEYKKPSN